jgi:hypothetical protein
MSNHCFLEDGHKRALQGAAGRLAELKQRIQASVEVEYADQLARASWFERFRLRVMIARRVKQEFERERDKLAPQGGRYFRNHCISRIKLCFTSASVAPTE